MLIKIKFSVSSSKQICRWYHQSQFSLFSAFLYSSKLRLVYTRLKESWTKLKLVCSIMTKFPRPAQPINFYALEGTTQPSSARISVWAGTVLRYSVGRIQEGGVFMRLHNISGRKSSRNGLVCTGIDMIGLAYCR